MTRVMGYILSRLTALHYMRLPKLRKKVVILSGIALLLVSLAFILIWAFFVEPNRLVVNEETIQIADWPAAATNFKIAVLSDLHVGSPYIDEAKLQLIASKVNQAQPDLIVLLGDFISDVRGGKRVAPEVIAENLKNLSARQGVFAVLGNHDWWYDGLRVRAALESARIRVLENDVARVEHNNQTIWLAGLGDLWTSTADVEGTLAKIKDDSPVIILTHNPDVFPKIPSRVSLTLAGHTHGGQVCLPIIGRPQVPSDYGQRYAAGHIIENNRHLFVTTGIGTSIYPVRFSVPPEIVILTVSSSHAP